MATPLALITIGAGFEGRKALAKIAPTMAASMIKLVLSHLFFAGCCLDGIFRGKSDRNSDHAGIPDYAELLYHGKSMNNVKVWTASVIVTTTLMAAFTLTGWFFYSKH